MAQQGKPRVDRDEVQDTINLIKSVPTITYKSSGNIKRKLTVEGYGQLLKAIEDPEDRRLPGELKDKLGFEYTSCEQQFEIRISNDLQSGVSGLFMDSVAVWRDRLMRSQDDKTSNAAQSLETFPRLSIRFKAVPDLKTPNCSMKHECGRNPSCDYPTLVLEVAWTETKEELQRRAEAYMRLSNGDIRIVVAVYMQEMWRAEEKNESRLQRMYLGGEVDKIGSYSYCEDKSNTTGSASILVWRAGNFEEKMFRDKDGNSIPSMSLQLQLQDFVCTDIATLREKQEIFKAPPFEISSEDLCERVQRSLKAYRRGRHEAVKRNLRGT